MGARKENSVMNEKLRSHIDLLFTDAPNTPATAEVKEELLADLIEHYNDLVESGKGEEEAFAIVISNVGDVRELIQNLKDGNSIEGSFSDEDEYKGGSQKKSEGRSGSIGGIIDEIIGNISSAVGSVFDTECPVVNDKSYSSEGIQSIDLSFVFETIRFYQHDSEEIRIVEYMSKKPAPAELASVDIYNCEMVVKNGSRLFFAAKSKLDIYLPKSYKGNLNIKVTSSSIKFTTLFEFKNLIVKGVSCSVKGVGILSEHTDINVASGSIRLEQLTGRHRLSTESGSIHIDKLSGGGEYKTTSGSIHLAYDKLDDNAAISVISGSVRVSVPRDASFYYNVSAVSGSIHTCFNANQYSSSRHSMQGSVGTNPEKNINIKAVSGSMWIQNNE